jgi:hypothetical protein
MKTRRARRQVTRLEAAPTTSLTSRAKTFAQVWSARLAHLSGLCRGPGMGHQAGDELNLLLVANLPIQNAPVFPY